MKNKIFFVLGVVLVFFTATAFLKDVLYDTPQRVVRLASAVKGMESYSLSYKIYYMSLIPVGTLKMSRRISSIGPIYAAEASTEASPADIFVRAKASLESVFDAQTNLPLRYTEMTTVNGSVKKKEIEFDRENGIAISFDQKVRINENTYDPLGAFAAAIDFPYADENDHLLGLLSKESLYFLKAKKVGFSKDFIEVAIYVAREDLTSSHGATLQAWLTNDSPRFPLVIKSWTPIGYASGVLDKVEIHEDAQNHMAL
jgi:hypothetical protein